MGRGAVVVVMWWVSGTLGHLAEHPETLAGVVGTNSGKKAKAMSFVAAVAYTLDWLMFFSDKSKGLTLGGVSFFGVVLGSAAHALVTHTFCREGFHDPKDTANHLEGATLMGVGGVAAMSCTIGQRLSRASRP